jgi:KDO2-lipid IV(A) lauroyltransferase
VPHPSYLAYRGASALAQSLPLGAGEATARTLGRWAAPVMGGRRRQIARNLVRATDGRLRGAALDRAVAEAFSSYGRYWFELFRLPRDVRDPEGVARRFAAEGFEHVRAGLDEGRGVILALPHLGGFDFAAGWLAGQGLGPTVVVEPVEPPELFTWFAGVRREIGMDVVALGPDAGSTIARALRANRLVCLLCDRDLTGDGVEVEFFGERTTLPAGPATLALRTGAPLVPVGVYFRPRGHHAARIGPPVVAARAGRLSEDVTRITQDLAARFEALIRVEPTQWHLMQPNWPSDHRSARGLRARS